MRNRWHTQIRINPEEWEYGRHGKIGMQGTTAVARLLYPEPEKSLSGGLPHLREGQRARAGDLVGGTQLILGITNSQAVNCGEDGPNLTFSSYSTSVAFHSD